MIVVESIIGVITICLVSYAYIIDMATIWELVLFALPILPIHACFRKLRTKIEISYCMYISLTVVLKIFALPIWAGSFAELGFPLNMYQWPIQVTNMVLGIGSSVLWCLIAFCIYSNLAMKVLSNCETFDQLSHSYNMVVRYKAFAFTTMVTSVVNLGVRLFDGRDNLEGTTMPYISMGFLVLVMVATYAVILVIVNCEIRKIARGIAEKSGDEDGLEKFIKQNRND